MRMISTTKSNTKNRNYWTSYWEMRTHGGHRSQDEVFLQREAREKLFHLNQPVEGGSILDFGCGSGDLLVYYAPHFKRVVGCDFSESMLKNAGNRITEKGMENITLIHADDNTIWRKVNESFNFITLGQVIQYFTLVQVEKFIKNAKSVLDEKGKIIFFDIIDPRIYFLFEFGILQQWKISNLRILKSFLAMIKTRAIRKICGLPGREIGYGHLPYDIITIANRYQFEAHYVCSMYYEYRYHLILTQNV